MATFRVTLYDVRRETFLSIDGVVELDGHQSRINNRWTNVWFLRLANHSERAFPQKWYQIHRVSLQEV